MMNLSMRKNMSAPWYKRMLATGLTVVMMNTLLFSANTSAAKYSPNFKGTEIAEFINIVGKNLKKTMIVDPNVRGKVNLRTQDELTATHVVRARGDGPRPPPRHLLHHRP